MTGRVLILNKASLRYLEEGDLIEFDRGTHSHWAVYVGDECVVHLTGDGPAGSIPSRSHHSFTISGVQYDKACVRKDRFSDVIGGSKAYKNNSHDGDISCRPRQKREIVEQAMRMIGQVGYNIITKNCEHFATFCRYGKAMSDQVNKFVNASLVGVVIGSLMIYLFKSEDR